MKILVTGGYGFIGSHLVERLIQERHQVTVIDDLSSGSPPDARRKPAAYAMGVEDSKCEKVFEETAFDLVVHLANKPLPEEGTKDFDKVLHANNTGLCHVLYLAHKYNVKKVVVLSSYRVYGRQKNLPIKENAPLKPLDPYGSWYLMVEGVCGAYRKVGLRVVVLRLGSVYGAKHSEDFINQLIEENLRDEPGEDRTYTDLVKDYVHVSDVVEAIAKACERQTSNVLNISSARGVSRSELVETADAHMNVFKEGKYTFLQCPDEPKIVLDNKRAMTELEWAPEIPIEEGIMKTIEWHRNNGRPTEKTGPLEAAEGLGARILANANTYRYLENLMACLFFLLVTYFMQKNIAINVDFLIVYIVVINAFYGWNQGRVAIALSVFAYLWLKVNLDDVAVANVFRDPSHILYMTMYFIVGVSVGYVMNRMKFEKSMLLKDLKEANEEMQFTNEMYERSIEIKNSLQSTIENYEDSLGKIFSVVSKLDKAIPEQIFTEAASVYAGILKAENVHIYLLNSSRHLRLAAVKGGHRYHKSMLLEEFSFLPSVNVEKKVFVNKEMVDEYPMVCAPIVQEGRTLAVVFLDDVAFRNLTHQFLNTLKVLSHMLSNTISRAAEYEKAIHDKKYHGNTFIMRAEWFDKLVKEKHKASADSEMPFYLIEFEAEKKTDEEIYSIVSKIIRSTDFIGEVGGGRFAVLLVDINEKDATTIEHRLCERGIHAAPKETIKGGL
ncbi:NAD-dependent epimerase/dehydratase family protein [Anaerotalea alkaliphila]|uniref:UDP-glucose 4-epimerase n=1 Tax=Anaerotalea alkaliphila TaxID=2662126 RepID=A0A7X5HY85_9FIRM|nr:NAD-dependent epimerase/dehydratase family protein [Anaerotalea alkaliphila]NDL68711.1 NAD-dependent epimerase/dehydratase family protein [Anaerotalea alkaliphila]